MHTDRTQTHVISCIYHIASSDDSEPWPIVIEDYEGNTQMAYLEPGDLLLYESAKNFHGRPTKFDGSWYTSLFVHFYPKGKNSFPTGIIYTTILFVYLIFIYLTASFTENHLKNPNRRLAT